MAEQEEKKQGNISAEGQKLVKEGEAVKEYGQMLLEDKIHLLSVIGEIEGHECLSSNAKTTKYEHVLPQLAAIEDSRETRGLLISIKYRRGRCGRQGLPLQR